MKNFKAEDLQKCGITFDASPYRPRPNEQDPGELPEHVESIRKGLLNFKDCVPDDYEKDLDADRKIHVQGDYDEGWCLYPPGDPGEAESAWRRTRAGEQRSSKSVWSQLHDQLNFSREIARKARARSGRAEAGWMNFYQTQIFCEYGEDAMQNASQDSSSALHEDLFDQWRLHANLQWTAHQPFKPDTRVLPKPKPDLTYGFPIFTARDQLPPGFAEYECGSNFQFDQLKMLSQESGGGLISAPSKGLWSTKETANVRQNLTCFPWAVVEAKTDRATWTEEEKCMLQAANASSVALDMLSRLHERVANATGAIPGELPPIIAFTCMGKQVQVWLTFQRRTVNGPQDFDTKMQCIFATDLGLTWGVYSIRLIIKHMHVWASRILRPKIAMFLSMLIAERARRSSGHLATPSSKKRRTDGLEPLTPRGRTNADTPLSSAKSKRPQVHSPESQFFTPNTTFKGRTDPEEDRSVSSPSLGKHASHSRRSNSDELCSGLERLKIDKDETALTGSHNSKRRSPCRTPNGPRDDNGNTRNERHYVAEDRSPTNTPDIMEKGSLDSNIQLQQSGRHRKGERRGLTDQFRDVAYQSNRQSDSADKRVRTKATAKNRTHSQRHTERTTKRLEDERASQIDTHTESEIDSNDDQDGNASASDYASGSEHLDNYQESTGSTSSRSSRFLDNQDLKALKQEAWMSSKGESILDLGFRKILKDQSATQLGVVCDHLWQEATDYKRLEVLDLPNWDPDAHPSELSGVGAVIMRALERYSPCLSDTETDASACSWSKRQSDSESEGVPDWEAAFALALETLELEEDEKRLRSLCRNILVCLPAPSAAKSLINLWKARGY